MTGNNVALDSFTLVNDHGDAITGELRYVKGIPKQPVVVICHSFMAFKDWGFFPYVAGKIAEAGVAVVTFNFSLNGTSGDGKKITDFSRFERNTFSRELQDLEVIVEAVVTNYFRVEELDPDRLALLGHSRGGGIAIVFASVNARVKAIVTWSAISTFDRWTGHQKEKWKTLGFLPLAKDAAVSPLRLGLELLNDIELHPDRLSIVHAAGKLNIPWLILHGKADVTVPSREAETLFAAADKTGTELLLLDHVGHLYNAASFDEDRYQTLDHMLDVSIHWLHRQLL